MTPHEIQKAWDRHLMNTWFEYPMAHVGQSLSAFYGKHGLTWDDLKNLEIKRFPQGFVMKYDFRHWVHMFLPRLAEILNKVESDDVLARANVLTQLTKSNMTIRAKVNTFKTLDRSIDEERKANRKNVTRATKLDAVRKLTNDLHSRSGQWSTCK